MEPNRNLHPKQFFHASAQELEEGTVLTPGGGESPFSEGETSSVYLTGSMGDAEDWSAVIGAGRHSAVHIYDVTPHDEPEEHDSGFYGLKELRSRGATVNKRLRTVDPNEM